MEQNVEQKIPDGEVGNTIIVPEHPSPKARNWFFTLNNYTQKDIGTIIDERFKLYMKQYCFQEEKGESGTKHLQGILIYKNPISFNTMKKLLPEAHWEKARNKKNALRYCCKEDTRDGKVYTWNYEIPKTFEDGWAEFVKINMITDEEVKKMALPDM